MNRRDILAAAAASATAGLGIERMSPDSFDAAQERIPAAAKQLADAGARLVGLSGAAPGYGRLLS